MLKKLREIEDDYIELFCQKKTTSNIESFSNNFTRGMYDHNFALIKNLTNEADVKGFITNCLDELKYIEKDFLKIVFHPTIKLTPQFLSWANQIGFKDSKIKYMMMSPISSVNCDDNCTECFIKRAETIEEIQNGLECASKFVSQRMSTELASKKLEQKKKLYLDKSILFYICYVDGNPIGYCDWFSKEGIVKFEEFTILNEYQGKGYGSKMLRKMISDASEQGKYSVYVVTDNESEEHNLYYRMGFNFIGEEIEIFFKE
jgi:spore maturation protein CgeE